MNSFTCKLLSFLCPFFLLCSPMLFLLYCTHWSQERKVVNASENSNCCLFASLLNSYGPCHCVSINGIRFCQYNFVFYLLLLHVLFGSCFCFFDKLNGISSAKNFHLSPSQQATPCSNRNQTFFFRLCASPWFHLLSMCSEKNPVLACGQSSEHVIY